MGANCKDRAYGGHFPGSPGGTESVSQPGPARGGLPTGLLLGILMDLPVRPGLGLPEGSWAQPAAHSGASPGPRSQAAAVWGEAGCKGAGGANLFPMEVQFSVHGAAESGTPRTPRPWALGPTSASRAAGALASAGLVLQSLTCERLQTSYEAELRVLALWLYAGPSEWPAQAGPCMVTRSCLPRCPARPLG